MAFRRSFFLPFDDDPEALFQLCFEASLLYAPDAAFESWSRWFQVDVETDRELAVDAFIRHVEEQHDLWQLVAEHEPIAAYIFQ